MMENTKVDRRYAGSPGDSLMFCPLFAPKEGLTSDRSVAGSRRIDALERHWRGGVESVLGVSVACVEAGRIEYAGAVAAMVI
jgi:hypothetical protein